MRNKIAILIVVILIISVVGTYIGTTILITGATTKDTAEETGYYCCGASKWDFICSGARWNKGVTCQAKDYNIWASCCIKYASSCDKWCDQRNYTSSELVIHKFEKDPLTYCKCGTEGLIIIKKGADGENYARNLAKTKDWGFIATPDSDITHIQNLIKDFHTVNKNEYLLIIGNFSEIPIKVIDANGTEYMTDPQLYGDLDRDEFVDLSVGRLPFSSEIELKEYYTDLEIKGNNYFWEIYPLAHEFKEGDKDSNIHGDYYTGLCKKNEIPQLQVYRFKSAEDLKED